MQLQSFCVDQPHGSLLIGLFSSEHDSDTTGSSWPMVNGKGPLGYGEGAENEEDDDF